MTIRNVSRSREGSDRVALAVAFLVGTIGGTALKVAPLPADYPAIAAAGWSAAVLFGYAVSTHLARRLRTEPETIGDNCYYLGFVFTLTSLAVTLWQISSADAGQDALRNVISGFGVALVSTIVGIALRVWLMRMRPDLVARDREVRIELYDAIRAFKTNLSDASGLFKSYSIESVQLMAEERERMKEMSTKLLESHEQSMRQGAEVHMHALQETIATGSEKAASAIARAVEDALTSSTSQFEEGIRGIREEVSTLISSEVEALRALVTSTAVITEGAAGSNSRMDVIGKRLDSLAERLDASAGTVETTLLRAASRMEEATGEAAKRIEDSFGQLAQATRAVKPAEQMKRAAAALDKPVAALEAAAAAIGMPIAALELAAVRLAEVAATIDNRPATAFEQSASALEAAARGLSDAAEALKAQATSPATPSSTSGASVGGAGQSNGEAPERRGMWKWGS